jgi:hypothetical protein
MENAHNPAPMQEQYLILSFVKIIVEC